MRVTGRTRSAESGLAKSRWISIVAVIAVAATVGFLKLQGSHKASAMDAIGDGDYAEAENILDRVITADPADMEAIYYRGFCYQQQRNIDAAIKDYEKTRSNEKWWAFSFYRTVEVLLVDGRVNEAKAEIDAIDPRFDKSALAQEAIGKFYLWQFERGLKRSHQLLAPSIGDRPADQMRTYIRRVVMADSKIYAASLDRMLANLARDHDFNKTAALTTIIEQTHDALLAAHIAFKKAGALALNNPSQSAVLTAHENLADIYETRKRYSDFEKHLRSILTINKENFLGEIPRENALKGRQIKARLRLAESRLNAKKYEDAIKVASAVEFGDLNRLPYRFERIIAEAHKGLGNEEKALAIAEYWLKIQPKYPSINFIKGSYFFNNGDYDSAYTYLEIAVGKRYRGKEFVPTYVECLLKLGKYDRANTVLDKVLEARPDDWQAAILKIQALEGMGWIDDARTSLNKMLGSRFNKPGTEANKALRKFMEVLIARNDLLPKTLNSAQVLYSEDKSDFDIGRRYLDLVLEAGGVAKARTLAHDLFDRCPQNDPARFQVMMSTGKAFETLKLNDLAIRSYGEAIKKRPYDVQAHVGVARNEVSLGQIGQANRALDHASALAPELPELHRIKFDILLAEHRVPEALREAQKWVSKDGKDRPTLLKIAGLLLGQGKTQFAKQTISLIESIKSNTIDEDVKLALLQVRAGLDKKAIATLDSVVTTRSFGTSHLTNLCRKLADVDRHDLVIRYMAKRVFDDNEISSDAVSILAAAYRASNDTEKFLNLLARLRRRGRNTESFLWAAEFCASHEANIEVLSITESSISQRAATPELLDLGIRKALEMGRKDLAAQFLTELKRIDSTPPGRFERLDALIKADSGKFIEAVTLLTKTLDKVSTQYRAPIWIQLIETLADKGQFGEMKKAVSEAIKREEIPADYGAHVARLLVVAAEPSAGDAIRAALTVAPQAADAWYDAGMIALLEEKFEDAAKAVTKSWELRPDPLSTYALAVLSAVNNDRGIERKIFKKKSGKFAPYVTDESLVMNKLIKELLKGKVDEAQKIARQLAYPSVAERDALISLIAIQTTAKKVQEEFTKHLARFFIFAGGKHTKRYAALAAKALEENRPERRREIRLMRARALMGSESTFYAGIKIVSQVLEEANNADEAALSIYAQSYIKSDQSGNLDTLVRFILQQAGFSDRFKMDLAASLTKAGFFEHAARLLHTCQVDSVERTRQEARALYKSGYVDRAAELLISKIKKDNRGFDYCQIVGTYWVKKQSTRREGYELLRNAVYRFGAIDDEVHLTFAKESYLMGQTEEARKNATLYLDRQPASAKRVNKTLDLIRTIDDPDLQMTTKLEDRRFLLDPRGYLDTQ